MNLPISVTLRYGGSLTIEKKSLQRDCMGSSPGSIPYQPVTLVSSYPPRPQFPCWSMEIAIVLQGGSYNYSISVVRYCRTVPDTANNDQILVLASLF